MQAANAMDRHSLQYALTWRLGLLLAVVFAALIGGLYLHLVYDSARNNGTLVHAALTEFFIEMAWALPVVAVLVLAAGVWCIRRGLAPLRDLSRQLSDLEVGTRTQLAVTPQLPSEVRPLVAAMDGAVLRLNEALDNERRFTADAAHELRTPLASLRANIDAMPDGSDKASLISDSERLQRTLDQLLELARIETDHATAPSTTDLVRIAQLTLRDMAPAALRRGVQLELDAETQAAMVDGSEALVATLLRNLVDNAVAHAPVPSAVTVSIRDTCLRVDDCGPGIPIDQRDAVFARFRRGAWSAHAGSGLGLAIVAQACQHLNATTHISESPSGGARVEVRFGRRG